jgi:hypothetical protein
MTGWGGGVGNWFVVATAVDAGLAALFRLTEIGDFIAKILT